MNRDSVAKSSGPEPDPRVPDRVREFAAQTVSYIQLALGVELDYTGDTLPIVDHYLRGVPEEQPATLELVVTTAGAYFGEVLRRHLGGTWHVAAGDPPTAWRLSLPSRISLAPVAMVAASIAQSDDLDGLDTGLDAPPGVWPHLEAALARMNQVTASEYFSLCGRLDTLEHLQAVVTASLALA